MDTRTALAAMLVTAQQGFAQAPPRNPAPPQIPSICQTTPIPPERFVLSSKQEAIARAADYLGLPELRATDAASTQAPLGLTATLEKSGEDLGPGIGVLDRPIWRVHLGQGRVAIPGFKDPRGDRTWTVDAFLDPATSGLLGAVLVCAECGTDHLPEPPGKVVAELQYGDGYEIWRSLPDSPPKQSLVEALAAIERDGLSSPFAARTIVAHNVMWSFMHRAPVDVWSVHLMGMPAPTMKESDTLVPVSARNHLRHIVDATTGKWLTAGTTPQPLDPPTKDTEGQSAPIVDAPPSTSPASK